MRASVPSFAAKPLGSGHRLLPRPAARRTQPVLAQGGGGGCSGEPVWRENVRINPPGQTSIPFARLSQDDLYRVLDQMGPLGFRVPGGISSDIEDVPSGGAVGVVYTQEFFDNTYKPTYSSKELEALLLTLATTENAGATVTTLPTAPFKGADGEFGVAIVAGQTVYVGDMNLILGEDSLYRLAEKPLLIRQALAQPQSTSPDLAAALDGVRNVNLFVGGDAVQAGLTEQHFVDLAADMNTSVVMRTGQGQGLSLLGPAAPAVQL